MNHLIFLLIFFITFLDTLKYFCLAKPEPLMETSTAHISPEILNELKDFENLIPKATIDEIAAEHYILDNNFRTAMKYLRSYEFTQLQKQLLNLPEIIEILEFLHLTTENATATSHVGTTKKPTIASVKESLDKYNDDTVTVIDSDNRISKMTTNTGTIISKPNTLTTESASAAISKKKRPQQLFYVEEYNNNKSEVDNANANANYFATLSGAQQTSVGIQLLEDAEFKAKMQQRQRNLQHYKYSSQYNNDYRVPLGSFTKFVEEVLQHLSHTDFQNMIKDKCKKSAKFAEFYQALRSSNLKSVIDQAKLSANISKIIQTLDSHKVDVNSLEPIAFNVISWGPDAEFY